MTIHIRPHDDFPLVAEVQCNTGTLKVIRDAHGSLNIFGHNDRGEVVFDRYIYADQAVKLENIFYGLAPDTLGASMVRLNRHMHDGSDDCLYNSDGECVYCGDYEEAMDHSKKMGG